MSNHHLPSSFATTNSTASIPNSPTKLNLANIYRRIDQGLWSTVNYMSLFHCGYFCPEIKLDELPSSKAPKNTAEERLAGLKMDLDELTRVKDVIGILMAHLFELKVQAPATGSGGLEAAGGVGTMDKNKKEPQLHSRAKPAVKDSRKFKEFSGRRFIFGRLVEIYEVVQKCREERLREHYELCKDVKIDRNGVILVTPMFAEWNEVINGGKTGKSKGAADVKKQQATVSLPDLKGCLSGIKSSAMLNVVTKFFPRQSKPLSLNDYRDPGAPKPSTRPPVNPRPATQQKVQPIKREPVVSKWRPPTKIQNEAVEIVDSEDSEEERPKSEFVSAYEIHQKTVKNKNLNTQENKNSKGSRLNRPFVNPSSKRPSAETSDDGLDFRHGNSSGGKNKKARNGLEDGEEQDPRLKNIDPQMVERIRNEIMGQNLNITWDDIAGLDHAKKLIEEIVVWPMLRPDIFKGLLSPPKGLLLFGPPGTGKTLIGKCIASQSNATFFSISSSSLTSKWIGDGEKMVRALFAVARCHQPAVVFVDEIDSLLTQRSDNEVEASRRIKTEFLVQLDGCTTSSEDRLLVIGATNRPQEIDEAARRRLQKRVYIALPEAHGRRKIITNLLKSQPYDLSETDLDEIARLTDGYSGSDMDGLCREAALNPIRALVSRMATASADDVRPINLQDFILAINQVRASVDSKELDLYIDWNSRFGSLSSNPNPSSTL